MSKGFQFQQVDVIHFCIFSARAAVSVSIYSYLLSRKNQNKGRIHELLKQFCVYKIFVLSESTSWTLSVNMFLQNR